MLRITSTFCLITPCFFLLTLYYMLLYCIYHCRTSCCCDFFLCWTCLCQMSVCCTSVNTFQCCACLCCVLVLQGHVLRFFYVTCVCCCMLLCYVLLCCRCLCCTSLCYVATMYTIMWSTCLCCTFLSCASTLHVPVLHSVSLYIPTKPLTVSIGKCYHVSLFSRFFISDFFFFLEMKTVNIVSSIPFPLKLEWEKEFVI